MRNDVHQEDANLLILVKHIIKWKKPIALIVVLAIIAAVIGTMPYFYPPKFQSVGVFYPAASSSISKALLVKDFSGRQDALKFGEEEEAEQLLQILESDAITNKIVEKYNLLRRYRIKKDNEYRMTALSRKYYSNVSFRRNEHMAIEVSVLDEDPDTAALICGDIMNFMDSVKTNIIKQRAREALSIVEEQYKHKEKEITSLEDQLSVFGQKGIINYEEQAAAMSDALDKAKSDYYTSLGKANGSEKNAMVVAMKARLDEVQADYDNLGKYGGAWLSVKEGLVLELEQFKLLKEKYEQAKVDVDRSMTFKFVTNYPTPAEQKAKPVRRLVLMAAAVSSFFFSALFFVLLEVYRKNKNWLKSA